MSQEEPPRVLEKKLGLEIINLIWKVIYSPEKDIYGLNYEKVAKMAIEEKSRRQEDLKQKLEELIIAVEDGKEEGVEAVREIIDFAFQQASEVAELRENLRSSTLFNIHLAEHGQQGMLF